MPVIASKERGESGHTLARSLVVAGCVMAVLAAVALVAVATRSGRPEALAADAEPDPSVAASGDRSAAPSASASATDAASAAPTDGATGAPGRTPGAVVPASTGASTNPPGGTTQVVAGYPGASNTGVPAGTALTPSGGLRVTTAGAVIENLDIAGSVEVAAANVTIRNCRIHGGGYFGVRVLSGNVTITDSELYGFSEAAITFDNWAAYRVNIHGVGSDGVKFGSNTVLQDSFLHDFTPDPGSHADGGQIQSGVANVVIRHNTITGGDNAALFLAPDLGPSGAGPIVIDANLLGSGNYTVAIVDGANGVYHQRGYRVTNNRFLRNARYGPVHANEPDSSFDVWSGNVWHDTGASVGR